MARIKRELTARQAAEVARTPARYRAGMQRALSGEASYRAAIKMKCLECVCFESAVERVRDCRILTCPIHFYRPFQPRTPLKNGGSGRGRGFGRVGIPPKPVNAVNTASCEIV